MTYGIALSVRKRSVRSAFFSLNHDPCRNSTAMGMSASRSLALRMWSLVSLDGKTQRGNCRKTAPSLPALRSGSMPLRK